MKGQRQSDVEKKGQLWIAAPSQSERGDPAPAGSACSATIFRRSTDSTRHDKLQLSGPAAV